MALKIRYMPMGFQPVLFTFRGRPQTELTLVPGRELRTRNFPLPTTNPPTAALAVCKSRIGQESLSHTVLSTENRCCPGMFRRSPADRFSYATQCESIGLRGFYRHCIPQGQMGRRYPGSSIVG